MTRNYITKSSPEIRELRAALKVLFEHNPGSEAYYNDTLESDEHEDTSSSCYSPNLTKSSGSRSSLEIRQPLWDEVDHIYRCLDCAFEVYYAYCQNCHAFYDMSDPASEDDDNTFRVIATDDTSMRSSRQMTPRGTTPLLQVDPDVEFSELLARGATAEMCKRFSLEFIPAAGIIAWLDEDFIEEFAGSEMKNCQRWMLYLGRCVRLHWNDDDGSIFMTEFLEEAILYPPEPDETSANPLFETYFSEYEDVWITRPRSLTCLEESTLDDEPFQPSEYEVENLIQDTEVVALCRDEYEDMSEVGSDNVDELEEETIDPPDVVISTESLDRTYEPTSYSSDDTQDSDIDASIDDDLD